jgi:hypothetical protein
MMRKLKALGLALAAVFALSAVAASSASATAFTSTAPAGTIEHITGTDTHGVDEFTVGESKLTCDEESFTANAATPTTTITVTPTYKKCRTTGGEEKEDVTVTTNGCTYTFTSHGAVTIDCPAGKVIEIHHYSDPGVHKNSKCTNTVGPQNGVGALTYTHPNNGIEANGTINVTLQTHGICSFGFTINQEATYHVVQDTFFATSNRTIHVGT